MKYGNEKMGMNIIFKKGSTVAILGVVISCTVSAFSTRTSAAAAVPEKVSKLQMQSSVSDVPLTDLRENSAAAPAMVEMKSISFEPKVIQVGTGQKVVWKNISYTQHSASGDGDNTTGAKVNSAGVKANNAGAATNSSGAATNSGASRSDIRAVKPATAAKTGDERSFDTGLVDPKAESKPIVFMVPGSYPYHCSIHGKTMSGVIIVKGNSND